ncbi:Glu-tRNA(Gln) amidotransferase subunit GatD [Candidatus Pacearchaeota archaeon]|nr:Glu-tRNA(Gln) amidotransferase subunit GatD [Candidatus Pacearchaeota archaeon]
MAFIGKPGDRVRLRLAQEEVEGTVLESHEPGICLLKLGSGYNIGISADHILGGEVLGSAPVSQLPSVVRRSSGKPVIGMVITGGTIASVLDPKTGGVKPLASVEDFVQYYPALFQMVEVKVIRIPFKIASESMDSEHWKLIAQEVGNLVNDPAIQGVVVTHGTDFLHYTAAALSFMLRDLGKPVVLTYSQRSIDRPSSDAHLNLQCAARMVIDKAAGVFVVGHATESDDYCQALLGTKVRKLHSSRRDAFQPVNTVPVAKVWPDRVTYTGSFTPRHTKPCVVDAVCSDKIALVKFYPGQSPDILDYYALKYKGIIVEASGFGHLPVSESGNSWIPLLKKHIRAGFFVGCVTQTINGRVDPYVYSNGRELIDAGVVFLGDLLAETALVKLGWILGHYGWKKDLEKKMLENVAGEFSERLVC